jgi:hypothetical protein
MSAAAMSTAMLLGDVTAVMAMLDLHGAGAFGPVLATAAWYGHTEVMTRLLADADVDPAAGGNLALKYGILGGRAHPVQLLLADPRVLAGACVGRGVPSGKPCEPVRRAVRWAARRAWVRAGTWPL